MASKSYHVLKAKGVPERFGLSRNIMSLLNARDNFNSGQIDATELGRLVRLSPNRRSAIANTISKCAEMIKKHPEEVKTCVEIIEMCTEILEIADRPVSTQGFPIMRLPVEIRDQIIELMIDNVFKGRGITPEPKPNTCHCPRIEWGPFPQSPQMKELPSLLGPSLSTEFFRIFFRKKCIRFRCCCDLRRHLENNEQLRLNVHYIKVHWCGPESAHAFKKLSNCPKLENLSISISRSTMMYVGKRTMLMRRYFPLMYRNIRITDALGMDELLRLRGLKEVTVNHAHSRTSNLTLEVDRANMDELLKAQLEREKEETDLSSS